MYTSKRTSQEQNKRGWRGERKTQRELTVCSVVSSRHVGKASSLYSIEDKTLNVKKTFLPTKSKRHLHEDVILLLWPQSFRVLLSCAIWDFCYSNLAGITKFKYERKNEEDFWSLTKCRHHANGLLQSISFLCGQSRIIWKKNCKSNQETNKQNKHTHADKQSRFS